MDNQSNPNATFQQHSESSSIDSSLLAPKNVSATDDMEQNRTKTKKQVRKAIILLTLKLLLPWGVSIIPLMQSFSIKQAAGYFAISLLTSVITLAVTTLIMTAVPLLCRLFNRKKLFYKSGNWLCAGNSLALLLLSIILGISDPTLVSIDAFIYFFVNKWLFVEINPVSDKQTGKALVLLFVLWMSYYGQVAETMLKIVSDTGLEAQSSIYDAFSSTTKVAFFSAALTLCLVSLVFMVVPALCRIIHKDKLPLKGGKWICAGNSLFLVLLSVLLGWGSSGIEALLFYFINKWFFVKNKRHLTQSA